MKKWNFINKKYHNYKRNFKILYNLEYFKEKKMTTWFLKNNMYFYKVVVEKSQNKSFHGTYNNKLTIY